MSGKWVLIDNLMPNQPVAINLEALTDITWSEGTLSFETIDGKMIEYECDKNVFIQIVSQLDIIQELE